MNLASAFATVAQSHPGKTALCWGEAEFSYGQLWSQTQWLAGALVRQFGVRKGDRVGLWLKNCPEFVPALFGILQAGAIAVPINSFLKPDEVDHILKDAGIELLITDQSMAEGTARLRQIHPRLAVFEIEQLPTCENTPPEPLASFSPDYLPANQSDLALIIYTSGTTGRPKGAMLSHSNLLHNVKSCQVVLQAVEEDRFALLLPMFHSFMLTVGVLLPLLSGGSIVLVKSLHPPKNIIQDVVAHRATILPAVPQFFRTLSNPSVPVNLPIRLCISGGAPLPGEVLKEFTEKFPFPLLEGYGLSEASPVVTLNPIRGPWKSGSIGLPIHEVEVSVQDDAGRLLGPGETGEICVRGGNVMQGYWNQPEETAKTMRQGWLLTGDVGYRDTDGYFFITDRKKDMLLVNGINVYPREIEELIYKYPGVKEAAVVGVPDVRRGEQALAFVAPAEDVILNEAELLDFLRPRLADYKIPKRVIFLPSLPRNATGKLLKDALRKEFAT